MRFEITLKTNVNEIDNKKIGKYLGDFNGNGCLLVEDFINNENYTVTLKCFMNDRFVKNNKLNKPEDLEGFVVECVLENDSKLERIFLDTEPVSFEITQDSQNYLIGA